MRRAWLSSAFFAACAVMVKPYALLLLGPEPDFRWRAFCDEVVEACRRLGVVEVFGLGAFPAPALHTDPVVVVGTSADSDLAARL